ncbi:MAG: HAD-IIIA family hydrolase [Candidatus Wolfebacteria bacterium]|nr:HAD-IIIA family hydrolase [Candidatus Wolfebacteria bacterium]
MIYKAELFLVDFSVSALNFFLDFSRAVLFGKPKPSPRKILIYKIGNIGDIVCAVPALIAIRKFYPDAKITLLTSPGAKGGLGAKELLEGASYIDELKVYYSEDIGSFGKKNSFVKQLRSAKYDLFIQLPDDIVSFGTLLRNMIFAKIIKAKSAFGFKIRTIQLFKKAQVDYASQETEPESLADLLRENGVKIDRIEYDFNVSDKEKENAREFISEKWPDYKKELIIAISPGGKRDGNRWPVEKFAGLAEYLENKHRAKIIILGGRGDLDKAGTIGLAVKSDNILIAAGKLSLLETYELLKSCSFLVSNSTGTIHLAAAAGAPAVGFYGIRDVQGRWFPYGDKNIILCHQFFGCGYKDEKCVEKSVKNIGINEAFSACDNMMKIIGRAGKGEKIFAEDKVVFLDRDGVINKKMPEGDYVKNWDEFQFLPGVFEGLKILKSTGYRIFIITNQRGIAKGVMKESGLLEIHDRMKKELEKQNIFIDGIYYCPHGKDGGCDCRKPKPGMFLKAAEGFGLDLSKAIFVGDSESDKIAGKAANIRTIIKGGELGLLKAARLITK